MSGKVVVIADDEPRLLASLAFIVQREGGQPVSAPDGLAALAAIREHRPVLALLDVMMPGMDGLAVTRAVRADLALAALPIVVITALGQADHERQALEAGATRYLRKPFDVAALRDLIAGYLRA
ncbi:MAG: response regulator [Armatimonadetes bacterium]|nr:response regulator [Armatimonadota bacterium]